MTDEEREWLRRLGFEQSAFTTTRWVKPRYGEDAIGAWLDLSPEGWALTTWSGKSRLGEKRDTLGLGLVPMLAFAMAEGWL